MAMACVLVIDDTEYIRNFVREVLEHAGHQVLEARDGKEALQVIRSNSPSLVIVDMLMPDADGVEVIRTLRLEHQDIKIIAMSGGLSVAGFDVLDLAERFGATSTIKKPFQIDTLLTTVNQTLCHSPS